MSNLKLYLPVIIFVLLGALLWRGLCLDPRTLPSVLIDKPLPEFELPALQQPTRMVGKQDMLGEPFLLNVWGSWCPPCLQEHPVLMSIHDAGELPVYGINSKDIRINALEWLEDNGNPYELNAVDADGRLGIDLGVYGYPETYLVDSDGVIRFKHVGPITFQIWEQELMPALAELKSVGRK